MTTWSGPLAVLAVDVAAVSERSDENGFMSDFQMASPKQIAATMATPAMAMMMSFRKFAPVDVDARLSARQTN
jgi:hypothetical protein